MRSAQLSIVTVASTKTARGSPLSLYVQTLISGRVYTDLKRGPAMLLVTILPLLNFFLFVIASRFVN